MGEVGSWELERNLEESVEVQVSRLVFDSGSLVGFVFFEDG